MNKLEYIQSNQYLRKGFSNLTDDDVKFFESVAKGEINVDKSDAFKLRFKQVFYHMSKGMSLWELRGLYKALKVLSTIKE